MWVLLLNDMRSANIENIQPVYRADSKERLVSYLQSESVEPYRDDRWGKAYRKGGPLEWFNPPWGHDDHRHFQNVGTEDDWASDARQNYQNQVMSIPVL